MEDRYTIINDLLEFKRPQTVVFERLESFEWDFDGTPAIQKKSHVINAINLFLAEKISAKELEDWADMTEVRDDVIRDPQFDDLLAEVVHALANPFLEGEITHESCLKLMAKLE